MNHTTALLLGDALLAGTVVLTMARLARRSANAHNAAPAPVAAKEEPMDAQIRVAQLLASAAGGAEAMTDCGVETDDTEMVAGIIEFMDKLHAQFEVVAKDSIARGAPFQLHDLVRLSMQHSPAASSAWTLWRLAHCMKGMGGVDVVEAAREVVRTHGEWDQFTSSKAYTTAGGVQLLNAMERAMRKLAASLPKEA